MKKHTFRHHLMAPVCVDPAEENKMEDRFCGLPVLNLRFPSCSTWTQCIGAYEHETIEKKHEDVAH